jgi:hypothetical protein
MRAGFRVRLHDAALEAGTGIGGNLAVGPVKTGYDAYAPLWAGLTIKPGCNWGVQLAASYDVFLTSSDHSVSTTAGLLWQPSNACSEPVGVVVR